MFLHKCYIRNISKELTDKLEALGYKDHWTGYIHSSEVKTMLCTTSGGGWTLTGFEPRPTENYIDCGTCEDLFLAIAAIRDDTDKDQYFVLDTNLAVIDTDRSDEYVEKGRFVICKRDKWNVDVLDDGSPCPFSSRNIPAHKAECHELIKYFNKDFVS